jgi:hypothetical protein
MRMNLGLICLQRGSGLGSLFPMPPGDADAGPRLDAEILAAEVAESLDEFLDHMSVAEGIGAKLNRQLLGFLKAEVLPQANRAAEMGVDPTPLFAMVVRVLRTYADALERPPSPNGERPA